MAEQIEIIDGVAHIVNRQIVRSVSFGAFARALSQKSGIRTPYLPPGVVQYGERGNLSLFVVEQAPATRVITHRYARNKDPLQYTIALPWVYFTMTFRHYSFEGMGVYFARQQLMGENDRLCYAPLPNLHPGGHACLGDTTFQVTSSVTARVTKAAELFWQTAFNTDLSQQYEGYMPDVIKHLTQAGTWFEGWSKVPAHDICGLDWRHYKSLGDIVDGLLPEEDE